MTYLQLCQKMVQDLGLQNTISSVLSQIGMSKKIVDWVADADEYIQSLWIDWNFLWTQHSVSTIASTRLITAPSDFSAWDNNSIFLDYTTEDWQQLHKLDYLEWRTTYGNGTQEDDQPDRFVQLPNHNLYLEPAPDKVYTFTGDYWKVVTRMAANATVSAIPARFHRIILAQAKIYYAEHDEFPTVYELASKEYAGLLKDLQAAELPGRKQLRKSTSPGETMQVVPE